MLNSVVSPVLAVGIEQGHPSTNGKVKPLGGFGLGSIIDTKFTGHAVTSTSIYPLYIPQLYRYLTYQKVIHNEYGKFHIEVYRIPVFGYDTLVIFPPGMKVYPNKASGSCFCDSFGS